MKTLKCYLLKKLVPSCFIALCLLTIPSFNLYAAMHTDISSEKENHYEYTGIVVDRATGTPLEYANFLVIGTNISIVSNKEGEFLLKIPKEISNTKVKVSYMGYKDMVVPTSTMKSKYARIFMEVLSVKLPEFEVVSKNPYDLIHTVMENKQENYIDKKILMKTFYRETVKNKHDYVSLAEAVVNVAKQPYYSLNVDYVKLKQVRKKTNYALTDTILLKFVGGPINCLKLDILKYPELVFTEDMMANYDFSFAGVTFLDNKMIYILDFKHSANKNNALYDGKLFIDAETMALKTAEFSLDLKNKTAAASMFIKRKPSHAIINPLMANYRVDYFEKDGKWYYGYSRIDFAFEVYVSKLKYYDKYISTMEMAVIDWEKYNKENAFKYRERFKPSKTIGNRILGFSDPDFWGTNNIIEPDQSIQSAIDKIRIELEKEKLSVVELDIQAPK